jgi:capsid portal protein
MANSRLIYFSDEAFERLESMVIFDKKGKPISRAKKINYLILNKLELIEENNVSKSDFLQDLKNIRNKLYDIDSMIHMQKNDVRDEIMTSLVDYVKNLIEVFE